MTSPPRKTRRRFESSTQARYLTCSCYHQLPLFQNDRIKDLFAAHLLEVVTRSRFELMAWVIMPNHFHLLVRPASTDCRVPLLLQRIKGPFARLILQRWRDLKAPILSRVRDSRGQLHFWQAGGGHDRNIVSDYERIQKIKYIHANPVRAALVCRVTEWRWSSAAAYAGVSEALIPLEHLRLRGPRE